MEQKKIKNIICWSPTLLGIIMIIVFLVGQSLPLHPAVEIEIDQNNNVASTTMDGEPFIYTMYQTEVEYYTNEMLNTLAIALDNDTSKINLHRALTLTFLIIYTGGNLQQLNDNNYFTTSTTLFIMLILVYSLTFNLYIRIIFLVPELIAWLGKKFINIGYRE